MSPTPDRCRAAVSAEGPESLQAQLEPVVQDAVDLTLLDGTRGILVTCWNPYHYTVELSESAPFGTTLERDQEASGQ